MESDRTNCSILKENRMMGSKTADDMETEAERYTAASKASSSGEDDYAGRAPVQGYDFSYEKVDYDKLFTGFLTTGFQATCFAQAVEEINRMVRK